MNVGRPQEEVRLSTLWLGILAPPVIWGARIGLSYVLVPYACWWDWRSILHIVTGTALVATALVIWLSWRAGRRAGFGHDEEDGDLVTDRIRFMALLGVSSGLLFSFVMIAEGLANFFVDPCQTGGAPII